MFEIGVVPWITTYRDSPGVTGAHENTVFARINLLAGWQEVTRDQDSDHGDI